MTWGKVDYYSFLFIRNQDIVHCLTLQIVGMTVGRGPIPLCATFPGSPLLITQDTDSPALT